MILRFLYDSEMIATLRFARQGGDFFEITNRHLAGILETQWQLNMSQETLQ